MIVVDRQPRLTHKVKINDTSAVKIERMCAWCHAQFGKRFAIIDRPDERPTFGPDGTWQCTWEGGGLSTYTFQFDHEQDAVLFALRWE